MPSLKEFMLKNFRATNEEKEIVRMVSTFSHLKKITSVCWQRSLPDKIITITNDDDKLSEAAVEKMLQEAEKCSVR